MVSEATAPERKVLLASLHRANAARRSATTKGATLASGSSASAAPDSSGSSSGAPWYAEPPNGDWPMDCRYSASLCAVPCTSLCKCAHCNKPSCVLWLGAQTHGTCCVQRNEW